MNPRFFSISVACAFITVFLWGSTFGTLPVRAQNGAPAETPEVTEAVRLNKEAVSLFSKGDLKSARPLAQKAFELFEKSLGANAPQTISAGYNLAVILGQLGEFFEAGKVLRKTISGSEKAFGKNDPRLCKHLISYGWNQFVQGRFPTADEAFKRALTIRETAHPGDDTEALEELLALGAQLQKRGEPGKSIPYLQRYVAAQEKKTGATSKDYGEALKRCACAEMQDLELDGKIGSAEYKAADERMQRGQRIALGLPAKDEKRIAATLLGSVVTRGRATNRAVPEYPQAAKQLGIQGIVIVEILIDETGNVAKTEALCGADLISAAALEAARKWKFKPTLLDGEPVKVTGVITFKFNLGR
jgi:TonB family protein